MIAIVEHQARACTGAAPTFEELLPAIEQHAAVAFRSLPPSEREDLVAEAVANAFCAYQRLVERGKADIAYATPLASFAVRQIRSGRRVGSRLNSKDVSSKYAQRARRIKMQRLDVRYRFQNRWQEMVVEDKTAGPAVVAATRIDFAAWLRSLKPRMRRIATYLAAGETTSMAAKKFKVSRGRISQVRGELRAAWSKFQNEPAMT
jgi:hypothetical protein